MSIVSITFTEKPQLPHCFASIKQGDIVIHNLTPVFDTGAEISTINSDIVEKYGLETYGSAQIFTSEECICKLCDLTIKLGPAEVAPIIDSTFAVISGELDMSIGWNILSECKVVILPKNGGTVIHVEFPE